MAQNFEFKEIRSFVAVAKLLHFRMAAETLGIAQPQLSRAIQKIETKLGHKVLDRSTRKVALTRAGKEFLRKCEEVLEKLDALGTSDALARAHRVNRLLLASTPSGVAVLSPLLRKFYAANPQVLFSLRFASTPEQVALLLDAKIHIGFVRPPHGSDGLKATLEAYLPLMAHRATVDAIGLSTLTIKGEQWALVVPATHRFAARERVNIQELRGETLIRFAGADPDPGFQRQVENIIAEAGVAANWGSEAADTMSAACLVSAGVGIAILPDWVRSLNLPGLAVKTLEGRLQPFPLICAWSRTQKSEVLVSFVQFLERALRQKQSPLGGGLFLNR